MEINKLFKLNWEPRVEWSISHSQAVKFNITYLINQTNEYEKFDLFVQVENILMLLATYKYLDELKKYAETDLKKRIILKIK